MYIFTSLLSFFLVLQLQIMGLILTSNCSYRDAIEIRQLTFTPKNHELDNNDNFSFDNRYICYDTRGTVGSGIENCLSIEVVNIDTGKELVVYSPSKVRLGSKPAPGVGAVSFHPKRYSLVFIHGPEIEDISSDQISVESIYAKNNRRGKIIDFEYKGGEIITKDGGWVDFRNIDCSSEIPPGAHRGGSHRHEYTPEGLRIGCTYDDSILPNYGRTIAFFEPKANLPFSARYYFSVILKPVPLDKAKPGDIVKAYGDSWIDKNGRFRGFIGTVKLEHGFDDYLFVAEIPLDIDILQATSGDCENYPEPPKGIRVIQVYDKWCGGIVRGSPDGKKVAFLAKDVRGITQVFLADLERIIQGGIESKVIQLTNFQKGVEENFRWHPSGKFIFSVSDGAIIATCVEVGENFGKSVAMTPCYLKNRPYAIVVSKDGRYVAFNRRVPTHNLNGDRVYDSSGLDFSQIFLLSLPEKIF